MLSESATATLSFLQTVPNSVACEKCISGYLGVDRFDVLKTIRELIGAGRVLCSYKECAICRERRLVAHIRRERVA